PDGDGAGQDGVGEGGSTVLLIELTASKKAVHSDFFNDTEDVQKK
uniref:COP9 signalosome complex subunit 9 n=1 Tax=Mastacembelus armatus TaxID=205130 RepID=A0A3Q3LSD7_9TELE